MAYWEQIVQSKEHGEEIVGKVLSVRNPSKHPVVEIVKITNEKTGEEQYFFQHTAAYLAEIRRYAKERENFGFLG